MSSFHTQGACAIHSAEPLCAAAPPLSIMERGVFVLPLCRGFDDEIDLADHEYGTNTRMAAGCLGSQVVPGLWKQASP